MNLRKNTLLIAAVFGVQSLNSASAEEPGFWGRLNPFRQQVSQSSETPDQTESGPTPEQLAELRQRLADRGLTEEQIDARIAHVLEARQNPDHATGRPAFAGSGQPTLEELREHLISRGVDPARIDAHIARVAASPPPGQAIAETNRNRRVSDELPDDPTLPPGDVEVPDSPLDAPDGGVTVPDETPQPTPTGDTTTGDAGEFAAESSQPETAGTTGDNSSFRRGGAGLRGGFGRGRSRGE